MADHQVDAAALANAPRPRGAVRARRGELLTGGTELAVEERALRSPKLLRRARAGNPQARYAIVARREDELAVGAERGARYPGAVLELADRDTAFGSVDADEVILGRCHETFAGRIERDEGNGCGVL